MKRLLPFFIGLSLAIGLVAWQGVDTVISALSGGGWGLLWLVPYHWLPLALGTLAWQCLLISERCAFGHLVCIHWIGGAVNTLLPVAELGGEIVRARLVMHTPALYMSLLSARPGDFKALLISSLLHRNVFCDRMFCIYE